MPEKPTAEDAKAAGAAIVACRRAIIDKVKGGKIKQIAAEHAIIGYSDIADYCDVDEGGALKVKPLAEIDPKKRRAIRKIREKTTISESADGAFLNKHTVVELELWDKTASLRALDDMRDDKKQKVEHSGNLTIKVINFAGDDGDNNPS